MHRSLLVCTCLISTAAFGQTYQSWRDYSGSADSAQYSALRQVTRANVSQLQIAWQFPTGDGAKYSFNPVVVDDLMYVLAKGPSIVALNASTGKEVWRYSPGPDTRLITNRGINYWESKDRSDRRLLFASNHFLRAIDARTGKPIASFGENGSVDLKQGLGRDPKAISLVQSTTPGRVFEDLLILGSATNQGYGSAPGDIRAFDVRTGKLVWTFHTIPHPGEFGYDTWPKDAWKTVGGANVWGEMSLDDKRGILYAPTASAKYNFYGADRARRQSLRRLPARARRPHRQTPLAFPDGASRHLGLRRRHRAETPHRAPRRQDHRRRGAGQQTGLRLGVRPRHRPAPVAHRRAPRARLRHARREGLGHAALPHQAAAVRAPDLHGGRSEPLPQPAGSRPFPRRNSQRPQRRSVHSARAPRHHPDAGQQRRSQLGRRRGRSRAGRPGRGVERSSQPAQTGTEGQARHRRSRASATKAASAS